MAVVNAQPVLDRAFRPLLGVGVVRLPPPELEDIDDFLAVMEREGVQRTPLVINGSPEMPLAMTEFKDVANAMLYEFNVRFNGRHTAHPITGSCRTAGEYVLYSCATAESGRRLVQLPLIDLWSWPSRLEDNFNNLAIYSVSPLVAAHDAGRRLMTPFTVGTCNCQPAEVLSRGCPHIAGGVHHDYVFTCMNGLYYLRKHEVFEGGLRALGDADHVNFLYCGVQTIDSFLGVYPAGEGMYTVSAGGNVECTLDKTYRHPYPAWLRQGGFHVEIGGLDYTVTANLIKAYPSRSPEQWAKASWRLVTAFSPDSFFQVWAIGIARGHLVLQSTLSVANRPRFDVMIYPSLITRVLPIYRTMMLRFDELAVLDSSATVFSACSVVLGRDAAHFCSTHLSPLYDAMWNLRLPWWAPGSLQLLDRLSLIGMRIKETRRTEVLTERVTRYYERGGAGLPVQVSVQSAEYTLEVVQRTIDSRTQLVPMAKATTLVVGLGLAGYLLRFLVKSAVRLPAPTAASNPLRDQGTAVLSGLRRAYRRVRSAIGGSALLAGAVADMKRCSVFVPPAPVTLKGYWTSVADRVKNFLTIGKDSSFDLTWFEWFREAYPAAISVTGVCTEEILKSWQPHFALFEFAYWMTVPGYDLGTMFMGRIPALAMHMVVERMPPVARVLVHSIFNILVAPLVGKLVERDVFRTGVAWGPAAWLVNLSMSLMEVMTTPDPFSYLVLRCLFFMGDRYGGAAWPLYMVAGVYALYKWRRKVRDAYRHCADKLKPQDKRELEEPPLDEDGAELPRVIAPREAKTGVRRTLASHARLQEQNCDKVSAAKATYILANTVGAPSQQLIHGKEEDRAMFVDRHLAKAPATDIAYNPFYQDPEPLFRHLGFTTASEPLPFWDLFEVWNDKDRYSSAKKEANRVYAYESIARLRAGNVDEFGRYNVFSKSERYPVKNVYSDDPLEEPERKTKVSRGIFDDPFLSALAGPLIMQPTNQLMANMRPDRTVIPVDRVSGEQMGDLFFRAACHLLGIAWKPAEDEVFNATEAEKIFFSRTIKSDYFDVIRNDRSTAQKAMKMRTFLMSDTAGAINIGGEVLNLRPVWKKIQKKLLASPWFKAKAENVTSGDFDTFFFNTVHNMSLAYSGLMMWYARKNGRTISSLVDDDVFWIWVETMASVKVFIKSDDGGRIWINDSDGQEQHDAITQAFEAAGLALEMGVWGYGMTSLSFCATRPVVCVDGIVCVKEEGRFWGKVGATTNANAFHNAGAIAAQIAEDVSKHPSMIIRTYGKRLQKVAAKRGWNPRPSLMPSDYWFAIQQTTAHTMTETMRAFYLKSYGLDESDVVDVGQYIASSFKSLAETGVPVVMAHRVLSILKNDTPMPDTDEEKADVVETDRWTMPVLASGLSALQELVPFHGKRVPLTVQTLKGFGTEEKANGVHRGRWKMQVNHMLTFAMAKSAGATTILYNGSGACPDMPVVIDMLEAQYGEYMARGDSTASFTHLVLCDPFMPPAWVEPETKSVTVTYLRCPAESLLEGGSSMFRMRDGHKSDFDRPDVRWAWAMFCTAVGHTHLTQAGREELLRQLAMIDTPEAVARWGLEGPVITVLKHMRVNMLMNTPAINDAGFVSIEGKGVNIPAVYFTQLAGSIFYFDDHRTAARGDRRDSRAVHTDNQETIWFLQNCKTIGYCVKFKPSFDNRARRTRTTQVLEGEQMIQAFAARGSYEVRILHMFGTPWDLSRADNARVVPFSQADYDSGIHGWMKCRDMVITVGDQRMEFDEALYVALWLIAADYMNLGQAKAAEYLNRLTGRLGILQAFTNA
jgi:hypothetical protein